MSEPYIGQIIMFGGNFAPRNYALCAGQIQAISQNTALFSLLGTTYGGDGRTTFALPDLRGRAPIHTGQGPGLSSRPMGQVSGEEGVTLLATQMPGHTHGVNATDNTASQPSPVGHIPAADLAGQPTVYSAQNPNATMSPQSIGLTGGSTPHNNMQPYQVINYCIALYGLFPPRS